MDPRNGCLQKDETILERIMLRFRPIAPKPATSTAEDKSTELVGVARKKRKYVRVKQTKRCKLDNKKEEVETQNIFGFELLQNKMSGSSTNLDFKVGETFPGWMKLGNKSGFFGGGGVMGQVDRSAEKVVESWMMVEGVSEMNDMCFVKEGGIGGTDAEKMKNLEVDACPGFISDAFNRVHWLNLAYRKLVVQPMDEGEEVLTWLVVKEKLPELCQGFACTVRVVYSWRKNTVNNNTNNNNANNNKYVSQTMPCDVWRMDFGGFAWRLDSKAALSLGR